MFPERRVCQRDACFFSSTLFIVVVYRRLSGYIIVQVAPIILIDPVLIVSIIGGQVFQPDFQGETGLS